MDDLTTYVVAMASALPTAVFKAEKVLPEAITKSEVVTEEAPEADATKVIPIVPVEKAEFKACADCPDEAKCAAEGKCMAASAQKAAFKACDDCPSPDKCAAAGQCAKAEESAKSADPEDEDSTTDSADDKKGKKKPVQMEDMTAAIGSAMTPMMEALTSLSAQVQSYAEAMSEVTRKVAAIEKSTEEKIDVLAQKADTATQAVRGAVVASETLGDAIPAPASVKKQDADPRSGVFDTAFIRR